MRDALSLTDQAIAYGNQTVNEAEVRSMLGAIDQNYLFEIIQALLAQDGGALIEKAKQMEARSISFEAALNDLANLLHQIAIAQTVPDSIANDLPERAILLDLAAKLSPETLQLYYQITLLGRRDIGLAPDEYAGFTMTLLRMLAFSPTEKLTEKVPERTSAKPAEYIQTVAPTKVAQPEKTETEPLKQIESDALEANIHKASGSLEFDGNWRNLVENKLKLGLARALAQNCELMSYDENSFTLRVAENQKHLVSASYQDKLSSAINDFFGKKIRLNVEIDAEANTPAKQNATEKANVQSGAEAAIMGDPFVQDLMQKFGAQIIPNSIKPN
jgi:DNA polymerase-3 subunit gamma/tau